jgi:transketolase
MDPVEAKAAADFALESDRPVYVRLAKRGEPCYSREGTPDVTRPQLVREGEGAAIVFHGSISLEVMTAAAMLQEQGLSPLLISVPMVQPLAVAPLLEMLSAVSHVVCVEEHFVTCGLGSMLARLRGERSARWELSLMGIPPQFIHEIGTTGELRAHCGIAAADIARVVAAAVP